MNARNFTPAVLLTICNVICFFSCSPPASKQDAAIPAAVRNHEKRDSTQVRVPALLLKKIVVDENYFNRQTKRCAVLTKEQLIALDADKLLPGGALNNDPELKLKIIDTVFRGNSTWVIISRETDNEQWAWLAVLNDAKKITVAKVVFYQDFVEYLSATSSRVSDTTVVITTAEDNGESKSKKVEKFRISYNQQLE